MPVRNIIIDGAPVRFTSIDCGPPVQADPPTYRRYGYEWRGADWFYSASLHNALTQEQVDRAGRMLVHLFTQPQPQPTENNDGTPWSPDDVLKREG